jgi:ribonuclease D
MGRIPKFDNANIAAPSVYSHIHYKDSMLITTQDQLVQLCDLLAKGSYIAVDTEFIREKTYFPILCLMQLANQECAAAIDTLQPLDLSPIFSLFENQNLIKVFHSSRQDLEIIYRLWGNLPQPLFDTQIAAMACGFGEMASFELLVDRLLHKEIDKSMRVTDWSLRPLGDKKLRYALDDVRFLCPIYEQLCASLATNGRGFWIEEEMNELLEVHYYQPDPRAAWSKLRIRCRNAAYVKRVKALAYWRELTAIERNILRHHVMSDNTLFDIAAHNPHSLEDFAQLRGTGNNKEEILHALLQTDTFDSSLYDASHNEQKQISTSHVAALIELLRVLLKARSDEHGVAPRLILSARELAHMAARPEEELFNMKVMHGWRYELFGQEALALRQGKIALGVKKQKIITIPL